MALILRLYRISFLLSFRLGKFSLKELIAGPDDSRSLLYSSSVAVTTKAGVVR